MPILFCTVARGTTVLAKYASCAGNFTEVTEQILAKIPPDNSKLTYSHGSYLFHYICEDRIVYLCITDDDYERAKAFSFLSEIKRKFQLQYGVRAQTALPYAMNSEFSRVMATQMRVSTDSSNSVDKVEKVQGQVDELKGIMVRNIDQIADRGERLELLVDKTEDLSANVKTAKSDVSAEKLSMRKTGGGPARPEMSQTSQSVASMFKSSASFHGVCTDADTIVRDQGCEDSTLNQVSVDGILLDDSLYSSDLLSLSQLATMTNEDTPANRNMPSSSLTADESLTPPSYPEGSATDVNPSQNVFPTRDIMSNGNSQQKSKKHQKRTLKDLQMIYYEKQIQLSEAKLRCCNKFEELADVLIEKYK